MVFFALLLALLLDQIKPLTMNHQLNRWVGRWFDLVSQKVPGGQAYQPIWVWAAAVLIPALLSWLVFRGLMHLSGFLGFVFMVLVVWAGLGVRSFAHHFGDIRAALERGDERHARASLSTWTGRDDVVTADQPGLVARVLVQAGQSAHQQVLGAMLAFMCLAVLGFGPMGLVLYRLSAAYEGYVRSQKEGSDVSRAWALRVWAWVDALPARMTAVAFAVVGHFEEAMAALRAVPTQQLVLAVIEASLRIRLRPLDLSAETEHQAHEPVQLAHLGSLSALVWRALALWLLLLLLLTLAGWLG